MTHTDYATLSGFSAYLQGKGGEDRDLARLDARFLMGIGRGLHRLYEESCERALSAEEERTMQVGEDMAMTILNRYGIHAEINRDPRGLPICLGPQGPFVERAPIFQEVA